MRNRRKEGLSSGEAFIYRQRFWPKRYKVRLSKDIFQPMSAEVIDTNEHVSLEGAGDGASFLPDTMVLPNGALSLHGVNLILESASAQSVDGVRVHYDATIEFRIIENKDWLERLLNDGRLKNLGSVIANRTRNIVSVEIAKKRYTQAIEHQGVVKTNVQEALRRELSISPFKSGESLGVEIIHVSLNIEKQSDSTSTNGLPAVSSSNGEFDLPAIAKRILHFLRDEQPNNNELRQINEYIGALIKLENAKLYSNAKGSVIVSDTNIQPIENSSLSDFMELAQIPQSPAPDDGPEGEPKELELIASSTPAAPRSGRR